MKTARKALMLILCAALLVSATVMGTLAYLTDDDAGIAVLFGFYATVCIVGVQYRYFFLCPHGGGCKQ